MKCKTEIEKCVNHAVQSSRSDRIRICLKNGSTMRILWHSRHKKEKITVKKNALFMRLVAWVG